jgi:hypothetical protein
MGAGQRASSSALCICTWIESLDSQMAFEAMGLIDFIQQGGDKM